jgi:phage baseplate assembly protein W
MARLLGFSTVDKVKAPYSLVDGDVIVRDLLNEFYTKKGERLMRPNFGSVIWDLLMNPNTRDLENLVRKDIERIIDKDPRAELLDLRIAVLEQGIKASVKIQTVPYGEENTLYLEYKDDIIEGSE